MWYNVRVVEQFSDKCRELSGSYPSKCSVIGLDNSRQLISINKMQTKTVATQSLTISVRQFSVFYPYFFSFEFTMVSLDIFFSALIDGYD